MDRVDPSVVVGIKSFFSFVHTDNLASIIHAVHQRKLEIWWELNAVEIAVVVQERGIRLDTHDLPRVVDIS